MVYRQMLRRLQRDMLRLLMIIALPLSIFFAVQLFHNTLGAHTMPAAMFYLHIARLCLLYGCVILLLRRDKVEWAWALTLSVTLGTLLYEIWLLQESGVIIWALFSLVGPALIFPFRVTLAITAGLVIALFLIVQFAFPIYPELWVSYALFFATIMCGFAAMGVIIRRFIAQFAANMVKTEREAAERARLEQQMRDLQQEIARLASLDHDMRQPLRAAQGYLTLLGSECSAAGELVLPAIAAAQRAERLVSNLLDQTRSRARQTCFVRRIVNAE
jgi:signal transduction histidine kinase